MPNPRENTENKNYIRLWIALVNISGKGEECENIISAMSESLDSEQRRRVIRASTDKILTTRIELVRDLNTINSVMQDLGASYSYKRLCVTDRMGVDSAGPHPENKTPVELATLAATLEPGPKRGYVRCWLERAVELAHIRLAGKAAELFEMYPDSQKPKLIRILEDRKIPVAGKGNTIHKQGIAYVEFPPNQIVRKIAEFQAQLDSLGKDYDPAKCKFSQPVERAFGTTYAVCLASENSSAILR